MEGSESNGDIDRRKIYANAKRNSKSRASTKSFFKKSSSMFSKSTSMSTARRANADGNELDLSGFRKLPPFEAFTKFGWISVIMQTIVGIAGTVLSYYSGDGVIGGVMSGIFGLWFVQLAWVMSLPSNCSSLPYHIGLFILPWSKAVGFLVVPGPNGEVVDWREFLRRMAILVIMWCYPMWLAGNTTAEVVRCMHGDYSRYKDRNMPDSKTIFGQRVSKEIPIDSEGIGIRERAMACTVKYIMILPIVVYITFNSVGALIEAGEYSAYGGSAEVIDTFEFQIGRQFFVDYVRVAYSNIFQGLVSVFTMISISAFSCSAMDLGEIMIFRFHRWEMFAICANALFFVAGVYFGSAIFDPINPVQFQIAYWSIWVLPCILMFTLYWLTRTVLWGNNELTKQRIETEEYEEEYDRMPHTISDFTSMDNWTSFKMNKKSSLGAIREEKESSIYELMDRIDMLEKNLKDTALQQRKRKDSKIKKNTTFANIVGMNNMTIEMKEM